MKRAFRAVTVILMTSLCGQIMIKLIARRMSFMSDAVRRRRNRRSTHDLSGNPAPTGNECDIHQVLLRLRTDSGLVDFLQLQMQINRVMKKNWRYLTILKHLVENGPQADFMSWANRRVTSPGEGSFDGRGGPHLTSLLAADLDGETLVTL